MMINQRNRQNKKKDEEENPTIKNRRFAAIHDRDPTGSARVKMHHEKGDRHFAAGDQGNDAGEQADGNQKTAHELDPTADQPERVERLRWFSRRREPPENFLGTVAGEHETDDNAHDAINGIREALERIHEAEAVPRAARCQDHRKQVIPKRKD